MAIDQIPGSGSRDDPFDFLNSDDDEDFESRLLGGDGPGDGNGGGPLDLPIPGSGPLIGSEPGLPSSLGGDQGGYGNRLSSLLAEIPSDDDLIDPADLIGGRGAALSGQAPSGQHRGLGDVMIGDKDSNLMIPAESIGGQLLGSGVLHNPPMIGEEYAPPGGYQAAGGGGYHGAQDILIGEANPSASAIGGGYAPRSSFAAPDFPSFDHQDPMIGGGGYASAGSDANPGSGGMDVMIGGPPRGGNPPVGDPPGSQGGVSEIFNFQPLGNPLGYSAGESVPVHSHVEAIETSPEDLAIVGMDFIKRWASLRVKAFDPANQKSGSPTPKGLLLLGLPGTGKKHMARALASLFKLPIRRLKLESLMLTPPSSWTDALEVSLREIEDATPSVVMIDDVDQIMEKCRQGSDSLVDEGFRLVNHLVTWLTIRTVPILVVLTGTRLRHIPPGLCTLRNAVDEVFFVNLPTSRERHQILEKALKSGGHSPEKVDIRQLVAASDGLTGGEVGRAVHFGQYEAQSENRSMNTQDVVRVMRESPPCARRLSPELAELKQKCAGFAVIASPGEPPRSGSKVASIKPGGE